MERWCWSLNLFWLTHRRRLYATCFASSISSSLWKDEGRDETDSRSYRDDDGRWNEDRWMEGRRLAELNACMDDGQNCVTERERVRPCCVAQSFGSAVFFRGEIRESALLPQNSPPHLLIQQAGTDHARRKSVECVRSQLVGQIAPCSFGERYNKVMMQTTEISGTRLSSRTVGLTAQNKAREQSVSQERVI